MRVHRRTLITPGGIRAKELQAAAAAGSTSGLHVTTIAHVAERLAGGFITRAGVTELREAVFGALRTTDLGELNVLAELPGATGAALSTLTKVWLAGMNLKTYVAPTPQAQQRVAQVYRLEVATKGLLPGNQLAPPDLVARALERARHAPRVLGAVTVVGVIDLVPVWRPLLLELSNRVHVTWNAVGSGVPVWLQGTNIEVITEPVRSPTLTAVSAATANDEVIEALRWARELMASGKARPHEIALTAAGVEDFDPYVLALRDDSALPIHFVHGIPITTTWAGQTAAALADVLARGPSQTRLKRLARFQGTQEGLLGALPERWTTVLPPSSPLDRPEAWTRFLNQLTPASWPEGQDGTELLRQVVSVLEPGLHGAEAAGEAFLSGPALQIWRQALALGPAALIDQTLGNMRQADDYEPTSSVAWGAASQVAAAPRAHTRLLGLNSGSWPRSRSEDPLLPNHVIPTDILDPLPAAELDRRHFRAILETTLEAVVMSQARHGREGRVLGASPLFADPALKNLAPAVRLKRHRVPEHAFSENDRLSARLEDFALSAQSRGAEACWAAWHATELTPHDGLVRPNHPLVLQSLERRQSASSLRLLLRQPIGFVWRYALGIRESDEDDEALVLTPLAIGDILHQTVNRALATLRDDPGKALNEAVSAALGEVAEEWLLNQHTPPKQIWESQLHDLVQDSEAALELTKAQPPLTNYWTELSFGGEQTTSPTNAAPWDMDAAVEIPGTGFTIGGRIDRLDLDAEGAHARVIDYKTGRLPSKPGEYVLDGGKELQRSLYTFAVRQLLGANTAVSAALVYPRAATTLTLENGDQVIKKLTGYLVAARNSLERGRAVPGADTDASYEAHALALPAFPKSYWGRKSEAVTQALGLAAAIWDEK